MRRWAAAQRAQRAQRAQPGVASAADDIWEVQPREARMKELASCRGRGAYCGLMPLLLACVVSTPVSGAQQEESGRSASVRSCEAAFLQQRTLLTKQI